LKKSLKNMPSYKLLKFKYLQREVIRRSSFLIQVVRVFDTQFPALA
jgi:hypothetical protein